MQQWEYKVVDFSIHEPPQAIETTLNDLGRSGWELVGYVYDSGSGYALLQKQRAILKRQKP